MKINELVVIAATFVVRQLVKYGAEKVDWALVAKDVDARVAKICPIDFLDPVAQAVAGKVVVIIENFCKDPSAFEEMKKAIEAKKFSEIIDVLVSHSNHKLV